MLDQSYSRHCCTHDPRECFEAYTVHSSCHSQSLLDPILDSLDCQENSQAASFTENLFPGGYPSVTFDHATSFCPNLNLGEFPQGLDFGDLPFPTTPDTIAPHQVLNIPQEFAIDPALEAQPSGSVAGETAVTFTASSSSSPSPFSTSSQSSSIRCSWPTCEKEFKNRSDYKYVGFSHYFAIRLN